MLYTFSDRRRTRKRTKWTRRSASQGGNEDLEKGEGKGDLNTNSSIERQEKNIQYYT